jgi:hypothetical protein
MGCTHLCDKKTQKIGGFKDKIDNTHKDTLLININDPDNLSPLLNNEHEGNNLQTDLYNKEIQEIDENNKINNAQEDIMELEKYDEDDAEFKKMDLDQKMLEEAYEEGYKVYLESKKQNNINNINPSKNNQNDCNAAMVNGNSPTVHNYCENIIPNH